MQFSSMSYDKAEKAFNFHTPSCGCCSDWYQLYNGFSKTEADNCWPELDQDTYTDEIVSESFDDLISSLEQRLASTKEARAIWLLRVQDGPRNLQ